MAAARLQEKENGYVKVSGNLTFANVAGLRDQGQDLMATRENVIFDFKKVNCADSAALALLTSWLRYAQHHEKTIHFANLPPRLLEMAKLVGVDKLLPIENPSNG